MKGAATYIDILREYSLEGMETADGLRLNLVKIKENTGHFRTKTPLIC